MAIFAALERHDKRARDQADAWRGADGVESGADGIRGGVYGAADAAIGVARRYHQSSEVKGLARQLLRFGVGNATGFPALIKQRGISARTVADHRVDECHARKRGALFMPDEDGLDDTFAREPFRRLDHARVITLRKHNALAQRARTGNQAREERHCGIGSRHNEFQW